MHVTVKWDTHRLTSHFSVAELCVSEAFSKLLSAESLLLVLIIFDYLWWINMLCAACVRRTFMRSSRNSEETFMVYDCIAHPWSKV